MNKTEKAINMQCKAFTGAAVAPRTLIVEADGGVLVYDSVAGHYTRCHSLTAREIKRAQKIAANS